MTIYSHFLISFCAGSIYLFLSGKPIQLCYLIPWFIGGVLIDIDHIFTYIIRKKTINPKKLIKLISRDYKQDNQHFYIFHTIEFAIFFCLITIQTKLNTQILSSYFLHLFCDGARHQKISKNFSWIKQCSFYLNFLR